MACAAVDKKYHWLSAAGDGAASRGTARLRAGTKRRGAMPGKAGAAAGRAAGVVGGAASPGRGPGRLRARTRDGGAASRLGRRGVGGGPARLMGTGRAAWPPGTNGALQWQRCPAMAAVPGNGSGARQWAVKRPVGAVNTEKRRALVCARLESASRHGDRQGVSRGSRFTARRARQPRYGNIHSGFLSSARAQVPLILR
jgi:hypothetical protein